MDRIAENRYKRPDNISESRFEGDNQYIVVRNNDTGEYFQLKEMESKVWDSTDNSTVSEIRETLLRTHGIEVDESSIQDFLDQLFECGILLKGEERRTVFKPRRKHLEGFEFIFGEINIQKLIALIYPYVKWVFNWKSMIVIMGLCILGLTYVGPEIVTYYKTKLVKLGGESVIMTMAYFLTLAYFPVALVHEMFHGLACYHYDARIGKLGFSLLFFILPCFFIRTTDAVMLEKRKRIVVSAAGPFSTFVIMVIAALAVKILSPGAISFYAQNVYFLCNFSLFFSLSPVLTNDGYYILADALDIPNFHSEATQYFLSLLTFRKADSEYPIKTRLIMIAYTILSVAWLFFIFTWVIVLGYAMYIEMAGIIMLIQLGFPVELAMVTRLLFGVFFASIGGIALTTRLFSGIKSLINIAKEHRLSSRSNSKKCVPQCED